MNITLRVQNFPKYVSNFAVIFLLLCFQTRIRIIFYNFIFESNILNLIKSENTHKTRYENNNILQTEENFTIFCFLINYKRTEENIFLRFQNLKISEN